MTTGEKIANLRKGNNITQEQLAELLGVTRQSVSRWEMDLAFPETEKLIRLSKLFSCSIDYLLSEMIGRETQEPVEITADACVSFIRECGYYFLATCADSRPRLRPFGMILSDGQELLIVTDSRKSVSADLAQNSGVELASYDPVSGKWIRISGTAEKDDSPFCHELVFSSYPVLRKKYAEGREIFLAVYRIHAEKVSIS
mgnify:CR=1 FL=1